MRMSPGVVVLALASSFAACAGSSMPSMPTPVPAAPEPAPPPVVSLVTFFDPGSGISTADVRDSDDQIVRFNTAGELIWVADDTRFPGFPIHKPFIMDDYSYRVVFGTKDGERRAYFAAHGEDVMYDIESVNGRLIITATNLPVPGTQP